MAKLCLNVGGKGSEREQGWPDSRGGDGAEALLPGRVPDLQLHFLPVDLHSPNLKIHSDRGDVTACTHTDVSRAHRPPWSDHALNGTGDPGLHHPAPPRSLQVPGGHSPEQKRQSPSPKVRATDRIQ